jgi:hypothetical protein
MKAKEVVDLQNAFQQLFGKPEYFGEWYLKVDASLYLFLLEYENKSKKLFIQLRYLYLYLESLQILKKQDIDKDFSVAKFMGRDTWYCCVLLLLVGLIDQHTSHEKNAKGKKCSMKKRLELVFGKLLPREKDFLLMHYGGQKKYSSVKDIIKHMYATRNFFAHEIVLPSGALPQDTWLAHDTQNLGVSYVNLPHGQIFLIIIIAFLRYLGFEGAIEIKTNEKLNDLSDFLRHT